MQIEALENVDAVADRAAQIIARCAIDAVATRRKFNLALSGGWTPRAMLRALAREPLPWHGIQIFQVDERVAPHDHPDRNSVMLQEGLAGAPLDPWQFHMMPVESEDLTDAASRYAATLGEFAGSPPLIDLVQLGLGSDGHTASLVPGDAALEVADQDVTLTGYYQGRRRMTLTYPAINRAGQILWVVTGAEKSDAFRRLCDGDLSIPAGHVRRDTAILIADQAAANDVS